MSKTITLELSAKEAGIVASALNAFAVLAFDPKVLEEHSADSIANLIGTITGINKRIGDAAYAQIVDLIGK
ncbi:Uncharacterised protein [Mycobacteroides abscessus subsp. abscessus]|uniref:hypothetical protein n=1 Tax=Mycobacteroides abscessus TaxID=36809 RepID=UPI00092AAE97|nr:hypothetical protein [Mycobacteroides abscessus]SIL73628.1 Uncharacterised protein [Mycobacteroides abscessus subsp. abscessus]